MNNPITFKKILYLELVIILSLFLSAVGGAAVTNAADASLKMRIIEPDCRTVRSEGEAKYIPGCEELPGDSSGLSASSQIVQKLASISDISALSSFGASAYDTKTLPRTPIMVGNHDRTMSSDTGALFNVLLMISMGIIFILVITRIRKITNT